MRRTGSISSFFTTAAPIKPSALQLTDVLEVRRGIQTEVLKKASLVDPFCCFSVVTADRTLDITMPSTLSRDMVIRGLQVILEAYPSVRFL